MDIPPYSPVAQMARAGDQIVAGNDAPISLRCSSCGKKLGEVRRLCDGMYVTHLYRTKTSFHLADIIERCPRCDVEVTFFICVERAALIEALKR